MDHIIGQAPPASRNAAAANMTIYGIGTDIVQVSRVAAVMTRTNGRFAEKVLGPDELRVYHARHARSAARGLAFLATRFSASTAWTASQSCLSTMAACSPA